MSRQKATFVHADEWQECRRRIFGDFLQYDPSNYLLMHAMGSNVAGVIGSAVAAGAMLGFLG